jgi:recombination protein RecA
MGDQHMGLQARLMSQALRKLTGSISRSRTAVVFLNQMRMKIGVMFGNPETTPGGRALKFYASVRIDLRRIQTIKSGEHAIGSRTRAKVVKNKVAPPYRNAEFEILFDRGISYEGDLLDLAVETGVIEKMGAWMSYGDVRLGQGRESVRQFIEQNPDLAAEMREKVIAAKGAGVVGKAGAAPAGESAAESEADVEESEGE